MKSLLKKHLILVTASIALVGCSLEEAPTGNEELSNSHNEATQEMVEEGVEQLRVSAVGDVIGHSGIYKAADPNQTEEYNFDQMFDYVKPIFDESDLNLVNLETTLSAESSEYSGYPSFVTPKELIEGLDYAGFNGIVTANNHSMDNLVKGAVQTVQWIEKQGLPAIGTSIDDDSERFYTETINGIDVAIVAFTSFVNGQETNWFTNEEMYQHINLLEEEIIEKEINAVKETDPDIILAYAHWGEEYTSELSEEQKHFAQVFAELGVDAVIGSHPHVIQEAEMITYEDHEMFIIYSVGNFLSNQRFESLGEAFRPTEDGVIVHLDFERLKDTDSVELTHVSFTPTWVQRNAIEGGRYEYTILPAADSNVSDFSEDTRIRMKDSYDRTMERLKFSYSEKN